MSRYAFLLVVTLFAAALTASAHEITPRGVQLPSGEVLFTMSNQTAADLSIGTDIAAGTIRVHSYLSGDAMPLRPGEYRQLMLPGRPYQVVLDGAAIGGAVSFHGAHGYALTIQTLSSNQPNAYVARLVEDGDLVLQSSFGPAIGTTVVRVAAPTATWTRSVSATAFTAVYACPRHPDVRSMLPGDCRICTQHLQAGLDVWQVPRVTVNPTTTVVDTAPASIVRTRFVCADCGVAYAAAGRCTGCGDTLVAEQVFFRCDAHPLVLAATPMICGECGQTMKLVIVRPE